MDNLSVYRNTQKRVVELVHGLTPEQEQQTVPACPDWTVHDLVAHTVGTPSALSSGQFPTGDVQAWLDGLVEDRRATALDELLAEWEGCGEALDAPIGGGAGNLLVVDLVVHEHDLRGAIGRSGARDTAEVAHAVPLVLEALAGPLADAGLGAIEVRDGSTVVRSHDADAGWTLTTSSWEALRVLESRRTADEIRAVPADGTADPYLTVLAAHLPLPVSSLAE